MVTGPKAGRRRHKAWQRPWSQRSRNRAKLKRSGVPIAATDQRTERLVYELYGLTAAEIKIVEGEGAS